MRTLLAAFLGLLLATTAQAAAINYTGHYELADAKADHTFSLDVTQTGAKAEFSFSAAMADGSGAAPDGEGQGHLNKTGIITFTFSDSFNDEGTGTLEKKSDGYHLTLNTTKVLEPRCLSLYGDVLLKKTADKPNP